MGMDKMIILCKFRQTNHAEVRHVFILSP